MRNTRARLPGTRGLPTIQRVSDWRSGRNVPAKFASLQPVLTTLNHQARQRPGVQPGDLLSTTVWHQLWAAAAAEADESAVRAEPAPAAREIPSARPVVTNTLPHDVNLLVGRDVELERIIETVERGASIYTIDGMPGVGKTALATRAAHRLADRFPDGCFFVSMHAHSPGQPAVRSADVLAGLLIDLGLDPRNIPDSPENRRNLWRSQLVGKRVLLVLDDAADPEQIEPLLPNGPGCLTLITSRRRLVALDGARSAALPTLDADRATELFFALAGRTQTDADRAAVAEIVALCGCLPLAIVLLAGRLAHHSTWTIAETAAELAAASDRLGELEAGQRAVQAAFTMSYRELPPARQLLFRRLGLHPGPEIDRYAAAVVADITPADARRELNELFTDHLLDEVSGGRYRMHDLLREYAQDLAAADPADDRRDAVDRLLDHYQHLGAIADRHLALGARPGAADDDVELVGAPALANRVQALTWLRTERSNLLACLESAAAQHQSARVVGLTAILSGLLRLDGPWPLATRLHRRAATVAEHSGDRIGTADSLNDLAMIRYALGDYPGTAELVRQALTIYRETGDRIGQAHALGSLGRLGYATGDYPGTADLMRQASAIYLEVGDRTGEAYALAGLGVVRYATGDYPGTAILLEQALRIFRDTGDRLGEAYAVNELGVLRHAIADYAGATEALENALSIHRDLGDRLGEAYALHDLASVRFAVGDYGGAAAIRQQALTIHQEIGDRLGEAYVRNELGVTRLATGDSQGAVARMNEALTIFCEIGDRVGEAYTHHSLGMVSYSTGEYTAATEGMTRALAIFTEIGDRVGQGYALIVVGLIRYAGEDFDDADTAFTRALTLFREVGDQVGEAYALCSLGRLRGATGAAAAGSAQLRQALVLFREIGDRVGEAYALTTLARLCFTGGDPAGAADLMEQALEIYVAVGDRFGQAYALGGRAMLHHGAGDFSAAVAATQQASDIFLEIGDRVGQAYTYIALGILRYQDGDYAAATELVERAPEIFREIGDRLGEAYAFMGLGLVRFKSGDYSGAADLVQRMLGLFAEIDQHPGRADMFARIGDLWEEAQGFSPVVAYIDALRLVREVQVRWKKRRVWRDLPVPDTQR
ncbi:hypothetical protein EBN03_05150 [Nocardia stercoris]|uniref:Uncharacterized protein n=1 Tax=Nocardia stercoris TaxID=2483361 RepID=A0A3M2LE91_9NOCA|nr:hypothetical protein EBN03_05150 [Nocardia stercoris]